MAVEGDEADQARRVERVRRGAAGQLEAENERQCDDVKALVTNDFSQWGKVPE